MIRVLRQPEPSTFDEKVRIPGTVWIQDNPNLKPKDFWRRSLGDLFKSYNGICSYLSLRIIYTSASVDHYLPIMPHLNLAYEWSNYRLADREINSNKGNKEVIDPFIVDNTWFHLNHFNGEIFPNPNLNRQDKHKVKVTIQTLRLNARKYCDIRLELITNHADNMNFVQSESPFIYNELNSV